MFFYSSDRCYATTIKELTQSSFTAGFLKPPGLQRSTHNQRLSASLPLTGEEAVREAVKWEQVLSPAPSEQASLASAARGSAGLQAPPTRPSSSTHGTRAPFSRTLSMTYKTAWRPQQMPLSAS